jgi:hypothetical protein
MEIKNILGIIIAIVVVGTLIYFSLAPKQEIKATVLSKAVGGSTDSPIYKATVKLKENGTITEIIISGSKYQARTVWNQMQSGEDYTFSCTNFFGSLNCEVK